MAYSEQVAERIRKSLANVPYKEQKMMGGIAFMVNGKMTVGANNDGNLMVRCEPERTDELLQKKGVKRFEMKGKQAMQGWLVVTEEGTKSQKDFDSWVHIALDYNTKLPQQKK